MGKLKTHKSVAKRFRVTKNRKVKRSKAGKSHILSKKSRNRKRRLGMGGAVNPTDRQRILRQLPYA